MSNSLNPRNQPDILLRVVHDSELRALNAVGLQLALRYGCMISIGDEPPRFRGAGTLVRVDDEVYVATARHHFDGLSANLPICAWWGPRNAKLCMPVRSVKCGPPDLDIAAMPLGNPSDTAGVPLSQVDAAGEDDLQDLMVIPGLIAQFTEASRLRKALETEWWTVGLYPLSEDHWPDVKPPGRPGTDIFAHYSKRYVLDENGNPDPEIPLFGLGGGGVWSVPIDARKGPNPHDRARLVGLQSTTEEGTRSWLRATRIHEWLRLVRS